MQSRLMYILTACLLFGFIACNLTASGTHMFTDTDPMWHAASGDLLRHADVRNLTDPWSYTANHYRWLDISWLWDEGLSYVIEHIGWHGAAALNAINVALIIVVTYLLCLRATGAIVPSLLATGAAMTLLSLSLRPLQITTLMSLVWIGVLGGVARGQMRQCWLWLLPVTMILWANCHGGFIMGFVLLAFYAGETLIKQSPVTMKYCVFIMLAALAAALITPFGFDIIEAVRRPMAGESNRINLEWQPPTLNSMHELLKHFDLLWFPLFALFATRRVRIAEKALAVLWFALSFTADRYLSLYAVFAAPMIASGMTRMLTPVLRSKPFALTGEALTKTYAHRPVAILAMLAVCITALWLPSPMAARHYQQDNLTPPSLAPEIFTLLHDYPHMRLLTHYNLGGVLVYETRGRVPVFIDARAETAYPPEVTHDYTLFELGEPGWEAMLLRWRIGGVLLPNNGVDKIMQRMRSLPGWREAYRGPTATLFVRQ